MNKENRIPFVKCNYCLNEATGIIYRPKNQLDNVLACTNHATNLFIPFKNNNFDKKLLSQSRYRSPMKKSHLSEISQVNPLQNNPQQFFDKLMENIISQFNTMKKQVMTNYNSMKNMTKTQQSLKFRMQGDPAYPYMIINNDQDMMMSTFVTRIIGKHNEATEKRKRQEVSKRRMELSKILSSKNLPHSKFADLKQVNSLFLSRSMQASPQKLKNETSIQKSTQITQRKPVIFRDYSKTQKRDKN